MARSAYTGAAVLAATVVLLTVQGCSLRPSPGIPRDISVAQVLSAIETYTIRVNDFSGSARAGIRTENGSYSAQVRLRYHAPDHFRIDIKGFGGITTARIGVLADSMVVYVPPENLYITAERSDNVLGLLVPDSRINLEALLSVFDAENQVRDHHDEIIGAMEHLGRRVSLELKRGDVLHRYTVEGPELRLVKEDINRADGTVWHKTFSDYRRYNGVYFPGTITLDRGGTVFTATFSNCVINSGLTDADLTFTIPDSAERYTIGDER